MPSDYARAKQEEWKALVHFACSTPADQLEHQITQLSEETKTKIGLLKRKCEAVRFKREQGWDEEAIVGAGQGATLQAYAAAKKNGHFEPQRILRWRVSRSLADAIQCEDPSPDQVEPMVNRLTRLKIVRTSEDLWEFLNSVFSDWSDADLIHYAGLVLEKTRKK